MIIYFINFNNTYEIYKILVAYAYTRQHLKENIKRHQNVPLKIFYQL